MCNVLMIKEHFQHNESYYDEKLLPNFTPCFQHTILTWIPLIFFFVLSPILFLQLKIYQKHQRFRPLPWHNLLIAKVVVILIGFVSSFLLLLTNLLNNDATQIDVVFPLFRIVFSIGFLFAQIGCKNTGLVSSGILFNSSLVQFLCNLPEFYSFLQFLFTDSSRDFPYGWHAFLFLVWFLTSFVQFLLQCWADTRYDTFERNSTPELDSSFLNRMCMYWFNPLPIYGSKNTLTDKDLFDLNDECTSDFLGDLWEQHWGPKIEEYNAKKKQYLDESSDSLLAKKSTSFLLDNENPKPTSTKNRKTTDKNKPSRPSVIYTLFQMFKSQFLSSFCIRLMVDLLGFANPLLLHRLLTFINEGKTGRIWEGVLYALLMFVCAELKSIGYNHVEFLMFRVATKTQSSLLSAVYKKTLRLSNSARKDRTIGETLNIMAVDIDRFAIIAHHCHSYWSTPFQVILALIFLFQTLGIAALPGLVIMLSFVPISVVASNLQRKYQQQQMTLKDERIKLTNEILNSIKIIKFNAWEPAMKKMVEEIREKELICIRAHSLIRGALDCWNFATPFLVALFSFGTFIYMDEDNQLTAQTAFVSIALFNQLRVPMMLVAHLAGLTVQTFISNERIKQMLTADEIDSTSIDRQTHEDNKDSAISVKNADFSWDKSVTPILKDINMEIKSGQLIAVTGRVGSGKSSLLSAILGEMEKLQGYVGIPGTNAISYVSQETWIQNITLKGNVLFGRPLNEKLYKRVIKACALDTDLSILPHGDKTEIGEKGINLSGGQKSRVSLARAVYQNSDIFLLDDPLAAVDAHVGKHIFEHVISRNGLLRNKTRVLVTHGISFLREVDQIILMDNGQIIARGTFDELMEKHEKFVLLMAESSKQQEKEETKNEDLEEIDGETDKEQGKDKDTKKELVDVEIDDDLDDVAFQRQASTISTLTHQNPQKKSLQKEDSLPIDTNNKLIQAEHIQTGNVKKDVYWSYMQAASILMSVCFVSFYIAYGVFQLGRSVWLSSWTDDGQKNETERLSQTVRMGVYAGIGFTESAFFIVARIFLTLGALRASRNLHNPVLDRVLHAPMQFFDSTPVGRVLTRFGREIEVIDMQLPINFRFFMQCLTQVISTIVAISMSTPVFLIVFVLLIFPYIYLLKFYVPTWRQLRRLESNARPPIYSFFAETIQGVSLIRAFNKQNEFCDQNNLRLDKFVNVKMMGIYSRPWFGVRLEILGNLVTFFAALFAALSNQIGVGLSAGMVGFALTYALEITDMLRLAVQQVSEMEINLVSVERLKEYTELETEADWVNSKNRPPKNWPANGAISLQNYSTRYKTGLELVVRNISVDIKPSQKVGIVGRTGAGKSSLTLGLFRMIEPVSGEILIDGVDISKIGLHDLRENITIIPQDPSLFSGTLRFNLDPFNKFSDSELWATLEMAHLNDFIAELPQGLEHQISEGGTNISMGQRQLICLARALLRRSKVLILDEASSSVDHQTDALIQATIRREFSNSTVITIAHRLNTILDYDVVLVLDNGIVAEFGSPQELLADKNSQFYSMAKNAKIVQ